jgi:hypothetical protein
MEGDGDCAGAKPKAGLMEGDGSNTRDPRCPSLPSCQETKTSPLTGTRGKRNKEELQASLNHRTLPRLLQSVFTLVRLATGTSDLGITSGGKSGPRPVG